MRKYGLEAFVFEIVEECDIDQLNEREKYWINYYNSFNHGYNLTNGGDSGYSQEQLEFSSGIKYDLLHSELSYQDIIAKYDISIQSLGAINNGRTYFDSELVYPLRKVSCQSLSTPHLCAKCGVPISRHAKHCVKCSHEALQTTERPSKELLLNLVATQGFAATGRQFNVADNTIKKWCKSYGLPSTKAEIVSLYEKTNNIVKKDPSQFIYQAQSVQQINKETGEIINIFSSVSEAAKFMGGKEKTTHISEVCKGKRLSAYGYIWRYHTED